VHGLLGQDGQDGGLDVAAAGTAVRTEAVGAAMMTVGAVPFVKTELGRMAVGPAVGSTFTRVGARSWIFVEHLLPPLWSVSLLRDIS